MVKIKEFCAIRYNNEKLKKLNLSYNELVCPPYDVISEDMYKQLSRQKYNFVHFELPTGIKNLGDKKYNNVKKKLSLWKKNKVLLQDDTAKIYIYEHTFCYPPIEDSKKEIRLVKQSSSSVIKNYKRIGLFCLVEIEPEYKNIIPHEQTKPKPVEDRLNLLKTLNVQTSAVFCLVEDSKKVLNKMLKSVTANSKPIFLFNDDIGGTHKFFSLVSKEKIDFVKKFFVTKNLLIADGHHRYKTACTYLNELQTKNFEPKTKNKDILENAKYFMSYICPLSDEGLLILPTHRAVAGKYIQQHIDKYFNLKPWNGKEQVKLVVYHNGEFKVASLKDRKSLKLKIKNVDIPAVLLNETVLKDVPKEQIFYHQHINEVVSWADKYSGYAFLLEPLSKEKFYEITSTKILLPAKTTYFYPKVLSGLCEYSLA